MLNNYSFVIENQLAASACPGRYSDLSEDLETLKADGVTAIVSLTETCLDPAALRAAGLICKHIPVVDYEAPTIEQIKHFCDFVRSYVGEGKGAVLVHCGAGIGRTGTMLSAYLISQGKTADEAIKRIRRLRPASVETPSQVEALRKWEALTRGRKTN